MRFELVEHRTVRSSAATICRIPAEGTRWRVQVETWESGGASLGRFVFEPEGSTSHFGRRVGPIMLRGRTREETVAAGHELDERRLRELLHSLV